MIEFLLLVAFLTVLASVNFVVGWKLGVRAEERRGMERMETETGPGGSCETGWGRKERDEGGD